MNITELARRLKIPTQQLREELPRLGFDVGFRAIKIDDKVAGKVMKLWSERKQVKTQENYVVVEKKLGAAVEPIRTKEVAIPKILTTRELADLLGLPVTTVIGELFKNGVMASINERVDFETASIIAQDLGFITKQQDEPASEQASEQAEVANLTELLKEADTSKLMNRPPVVVVMGHVDHGKTKLLDAIRETNVVEQESGAITQHIGAYQVEVWPKGTPKSRGGEADRGILRQAQDDQTHRVRLITFIDTPGHEAFAAMRSRGGRLADLAIIVIAADDGIKPQTLEAIEIAQREKLPFLIAINKIDKDEADIEKLKKSLAELNLLSEDWGGKTICVPISAKKKMGLDELLEMILLLADMEKFTTNPNRPAAGTIIEGHIDKGEGPVATALVQTGTLNRGDYVIAGKAAGKVRAMKSFLGKDITEASPSTPVKILGLKNAPVTGDVFKVVTEQEARQSLRTVSSYQRHFALPTVSADSTGEKEKENEVPGLHIVLKTDVLGSREAIIDSLKKLSTSGVEVKVVKAGLGNITEADIALAEGVGALVLGFHVLVVPQAQSLAKEKKVFVQSYTVIYDLLDEVKKQLSILLKPELIRTQIGKGKVLAIFRRGKKDTIFGLKVTDGTVKAETKLKIISGLADGKESLIEGVRLGKEVVGEMTQGGECGIKLKGAVKIEVGDLVEIYHEEIRQRHVK
ncbi:MAG: translation initiation factor IF-2 [Patescibacteria group bacterium]